MLQSSRLKLTEGELIIAGQNAGKRVRCSSAALPVYNQLVALAQGGNYWAGLVVRGIRGLSSGRLNFDNIFVQKESQVAYGPGLFYVVLPGVMATMEQTADGNYELKALKADNSYLQMQKDKQRPGLWRIAYDDEAKAMFRNDGMILKKDFRPVVVSDRSPDDPEEIGRLTRDDLKTLDNTTKRMVESSGFDLHYTPGGSSIVGLKPAKQAINTDRDRALLESGLLLANTMYRARNLRGVLWYSDWGGSAVLTRALEVLKEENIALNKHAIFLHRPTSSSSRALDLAKALKMDLAGEGGKSTGLRVNEFIGNYFRSRPSGKELINGTGFGLSLAGASFSVSGIAPSAAGIVGLAGALYFVTTTVAKSTKKFSGKKYK